MRIHFRSIAILAVTASAVPAFAQFHAIYQSDLGNNQVLTRASQFSGSSFGVGYDAANQYSQFFSSMTPTTAESQADEINIGTSVAAGSQLKFAVHAFAINRQSPGTAVTIYATLLKGSGLGGTVVEKDIAINIADSGSAANFSDTLYTSGAVSTASGLVAGAYTLVFSGGPAGGSNPSNMALVIADPHTAAYSAFWNHTHERTFSHADYSSASGMNTFSGQAFAARIYAATPVPEPSSILVFAVGGLALLRRKRKQA